MKAFVFALSQQETLPDTILCYNGGVKLTCEGSESLEDLKGMAARGVEIMTFGRKRGLKSGLGLPTTVSIR